MRSAAGPAAAAGRETETGGAMECGNVYGLLASVFRRAPTLELIHQIREPRFHDALKAAGVILEDDVLNRPEDELLEALAEEYTRLFIGPGKHVPPYASVHLAGGEGDLWGSSTAWVRSFIESAGFAYRPGYHDLPDHVSVELEFLRHVVTEQARAAGEADAAAAARYSRIEREFLGDHLARWIPGFCGKVAAEAESSLYREMAGLLDAFVRSEAMALGSPGS